MIPLVNKNKSIKITLIQLFLFVILPYVIIFTLPLNFKKSIKLKKIQDTNSINLKLTIQEQKKNEKK